MDGWRHPAPATSPQSTGQLLSQMGLGGLLGTPLPGCAASGDSSGEWDRKGRRRGRVLRAGVWQLAGDAWALAGSQHDAPAFIRGPAGLPGNYTTVKYFIHWTSLLRSCLRFFREGLFWKLWCCELEPDLWCGTARCHSAWLGGTVPLYHCLGVTGAQCAGKKKKSHKMGDFSQEPANKCKRENPNRLQLRLHTNKVTAAAQAGKPT